MFAWAYEEHLFFECRGRSVTAGPARRICDRIGHRRENKTEASGDSAASVKERVLVYGRR
jgi:hypothetical protein